MALAKALADTLDQWLAMVQEEVRAYPDEATLWIKTGDVNNSAGNLALHVAGNLQTFIGAQMGETGYVRDRPGEFGRQDVPRSEILKELDQTRQVLAAALSRREWNFEEKLDTPMDDEPQARDRWLLHLVAHLAYHHGQISYHRRILAAS